MPSPLAMRIGEYWRFFRAQNVAYQAMCAYLIVEYVRPQQLVESIHGAPLGQAAVLLALVARLASGKFLSLHGVGGILLLVFTGVIVASSYTAYDPDVAFAALRDWMTWVVIFFLIVNIVDTRDRFIVFIVLWMLCHYYMSQGGVRQFALRGFAFRSYGLQGAPGWFSNSGEFAVAMCMFAPIAWCFYTAAAPHLAKWRRIVVLGMPITAIVCIIGSSSRGALLGIAAVGVVVLVRSKRIARATIAIAVVAVLAWNAIPAEQKARLETIGQDQTSLSRMQYWKNGLKMADSHPALGIGYNNWVAYSTVFYSDNEYTKPYGIQVPHNIFIQCMAELGYIGLVAFLMLIGATLYLNQQTRATARQGRAGDRDFFVQMATGLDGAMVGFLVSGFFVTVLYYPFFWINLALTVALHSIVRRGAAAAQTHGSVAPSPAAARMRHRTRVALPP